MTTSYGMGAGSAGLASPMFKLDYPQSVGVYTSYADAQADVDALSDQNFPVSNLAIVGTDLKLVERVTGRKTWGSVLGQGVTSGLSTGLMVGLLMWLLIPGSPVLNVFAMALGIGILIGVGFAALGYAMSRGQRDFTSVTQVLPSKFEILCEHKVAAQARTLLAQTPHGRAAAFDPNRQTQYPAPQAYPPAQAPAQAPQPAPGAYQPGFSAPPGYTVPPVDPGAYRPDTPAAPPVSDQPQPPQQTPGQPLGG